MGGNVFVRYLALQYSLYYDGCIKMMDETFQNWTTQLRKGVLELCILAAIGRQEECYGYELVKELTATPGLEVSEGSIYPLLSRLRKQGVVVTKLVESANGPARKYYKLTAIGKARMEAMKSYHASLNQGVETLYMNSKPQNQTND